ncbi:PD-(D/E)XK nuclease family protein [Candidatus Daviesbacteria bacterium]|nr:PD-(D/E)XK nuclease family protein [Candidatus Daviesbacteria bacterium]
MPFGDGIAKINSYSLTDFHDFENCSFRFFIRHHLDKKYEIEEGNESMALGSLLDQTIKKFHKSKAYGQSPEYLVNLVRAAMNGMKEDEARKPKPSFYSNTIPFLTESLVQKAIKIFKNFYETRVGQILWN